MWTYWIVDTITGAKQLQVFPVSGNWRRVLNGIGSGSHVFQMGSPVNVPYKALTRLWARTLVVYRNGVPVYAGLITRRSHNRDRRTLTINHYDIRKLFTRRFPFGAASYWANEPAHIPGQLVYSALSLRSVIARVLQASIIGPFSSWAVPMVLPPLNEAGPHSGVIENYLFRRTKDLLDEFSSTDGGPDVDFQPRETVGGTLEYLVRTGTPAQPRLGGGVVEFNMTSTNPQLTGVVDVEDGEEQTTGAFTVGKGSEQDMLVAGYGIGATTDSPALDVMRSFKRVETEAELFGLAVAIVDEFSTPTKQWDGSMQASHYPGIENLPLGSTARQWYSFDDYEADGWIDQRIIGFGNDMSEKIGLDFAN